MLTERKSQILRIIVDDYVNTVAPVASGTIARSEGLGVSPATVRNEMVALEEEGFILRPHISAGGVPADKGYRHIVEWLDMGAMPLDEDARAVESELGDATDDVDEWADTASEMLSSLLSTVAFATPLHSRSPSVKSIELLALQEMLVMLVVIMREASVYKQLINTERNFSVAELEKTRNRVNSIVAGKTFRDLVDSPDAPGRLEGQVMMSTLDVLRRHEANAMRERRTQGVARLLEQPEFREDASLVRMALAAIESDDVLADLATSVSDDGNPAVLIGTENRNENLHEISVVICRYGVEGEAHGLLGVFGPTRMAYRRVIPLVRHAGASLSGMAGRVYGHAV